MSKEKKIVNSKKMTTSLIIAFFAYNFVVSIVALLILSVILTELKVEGIAQLVITLISSVIILALSWKIAISAEMKKCTLIKSDVPKVKKNLAIFAIIMCIITVINQINTVNTSLEHTFKMETMKGNIALSNPNNWEWDEYFTNEDYELEDVLEQNNENRTEFNNKMKELEKQTKLIAYIILIVYGILLAVVHIVSLLIGTKKIKEYAVDEVQAEAPTL